jgi:hypothetical protein
VIGHRIVAGEALLDAALAKILGGAA